MKLSLLCRHRIALNYCIIICTQAPNMDVRMAWWDQEHTTINTCYQTVFRKVVPMFILCSCSLATQYDYCNESYWDSKIYFLEIEFCAVLVPVLCVRWFQKGQQIHILFSDFHLLGIKHLGYSFEMGWLIAAYFCKLSS